MNVKFGDRTKDGEIQPPQRDTVVSAGDLGPHPAVVRVDGEEFDVKLKPGQTQRMYFKEGDKPPFYAPKTPPELYVGKAKGMKQVVFERGLYDASKNMTEKGRELNGEPVLGTSLRAALENCEDFLNETTLLEDLVKERGHDMDKTREKLRVLARVASRCEHE